MLTWEQIQKASSVSRDGNTLTVEFDSWDWYVCDGVVWKPTDRQTSGKNARSRVVRSAAFRSVFALATQHPPATHNGRLACVATTGEEDVSFDLDDVGDPELLRKAIRMCRAAANGATITIYADTGTGPREIS